MQTRWLGFLLLVMAPGAGAAEGLVSRSQIGAVVAVARQFARAGMGGEARLLVKWVARAGVTDQARNKLERDISRLLDRAKAKPPKSRPIDSSLRRLEGVAKALEQDLSQTSGASRRLLAELILALDGSRSEAHRALGHKRVGTAWVPEGGAPLLARRAEIAAAIRAARRLEVKLEGGTSKVMARIGRKGATRTLSWGEEQRFVVHTTEVSEAQVRRVMTDTLRATAVSNWLWTGDLEIPAPLRPLQVVLCGQEATYVGWVKYALARKNPETIARDLDAVSCSRAGYQVYRPQPEARWAVAAVEDYLERVSVDAFGCEIQPVLFAGHLHWLCLSYLNEPGPWHLFSDVEPAGTRAKARVTKERKRAEAGKRESLSGLRRWMIYLASGRQDPPWQKAIVDQIGKIEEDDDLLLKATSMAAFLQESGEFNNLAKKTRSVWGARERRRAAMLEALGRPFGELEKEWRTWLLPGRGLVQRLRATPSPR